MRRLTAVTLVAALALAGCTNSSPTRSQTDIERDAIALVKEQVYPHLTDDKISELLHLVCDTINTAPTKQGLTFTLNQVAALGDQDGTTTKAKVDAIAVVGSAIAAYCPQHQELAATLSK